MTELSIHDLKISNNIKTPTPPSKPSLKNFDDDDHDDDDLEGSFSHLLVESILLQNPNVSVSRYSEDLKRWKDSQICNPNEGRNDEDSDSDSDDDEIDNVEISAESAACIDRMMKKVLENPRVKCSKYYKSFGDTDVEESS